jgi:hypothetical protein
VEPIRVRLTAEQEGQVLSCPRCDTALLPEGDWPRSGAGTALCPLCRWEQPVSIIEIGDGFPYNHQTQQEDLAASPIYRVASIQYDEDLCLVHVDDLLEDPAFFALQDGLAPVRTFGWVGGTGLLGEAPYRLFLVVRVSGLPEQDLFRIEFPAERLADLAHLSDDTTVVLVSQRKGVLFAEAGEIYLEAVREAGGQPGDRVPLNSWVTLEE